MNKTILFDAKGEETVITDDTDYKERMKEEYRQVKERYDRLDAMTVKYEAGTLDFKPKCPLELLLKQKAYMGNYIRILKIRAEIEGVDLNA